MARRPRRSPLQRLFRGLYHLTVALSTLIVVVFAAYKLIAKPPSQAMAPAPPPPAGNQPVAPDPGSQAPPPGSADPVRREGVYTFLLAASDQESSNADTIMVCTYDTKAQKIGLVSVPRDTLLRSGKLNAVYHKGIEALRDAVSNLLGIPIDHYITVDINGFERVVAAVDGIDFNVPVHMSYDDPSQNLHIHFEPGMQHLSGRDALLVARCRKNSDGPGAYPHNVYDAYPDADVGRTRTQQQLVAAVIKKALSRPDKLPQVAEAILQVVDTDLTLSNILWFVEPALAFDFSSGLSTATLTGDSNVSYRSPNGYNWGAWCYQLYPEETLQTVNTLLNPYDRDLTLDQLNIFQVK